MQSAYIWDLAESDIYYLTQESFDNDNSRIKIFPNDAKVFKVLQEFASQNRNHRMTMILNKYEKNKSINIHEFQH